MRDIETTFDRCPDCGVYRVKLSTHHCDGTGNRAPNRDERVRTAEADPRDDDDEVLLLPTRAVDGSYAYHETDGDGLPACGGGGALDDEGWLTLTRREARERSYAPCRTCLRLTGDAAVGEAAETAEDPRGEEVDRTGT